MSNKYVSYISDEHLLLCIKNMHNAYLAASKKVNLKAFYANKVDTVKMIFDGQFSKIGEDELIKNEILRQIDKSINNAVGTFHEQVLGGIVGYEMGNKSGFDIKATDDTLFADIKNKHNTMNSSAAESLFVKLADYADRNKKSKCYWVQIWAKTSFEEHWKSTINGKERSHSRVFKISGDRFYALLSGTDDALLQLYKALPQAINDYLASLTKEASQDHTVMKELKAKHKEGVSMLDQITFDNYCYYLGFKDNV